MSTFACFLTAIAKVYFLKGRLDTGLYLQLNFRFSSISYFFKISNLKSFGNI